MRKALRSDVPQLVAMMKEFYAESGYPVNHERATEAFVTLLADDRLGHVFLIEARGQEVGYLVVTLCYAMEYGGPRAMIDDLFIRKAFRGAGLATAALTEAREICVNSGVRVMDVEVGRDNAVALALYQRMGFKEVHHQLLTLPLAGAMHEE